ncbi:hypothetical protein [Vacuolonema iberomarrocanum]|uniref:hypothetical protein n=1 Tax=Vacuolonema iberomarrocanum TaxID=3454632 RepID=UPI0019E034B0|nr:hypothetical protein [filamentous cyanobacterium LEGE 07170]
MNPIILWILGFGTLWAGLKLFDDEVLLIVSMFIGSAFVIAGLLTSPLKIQLGVEAILLVSVFSICMECIRRGDRP